MGRTGHRMRMSGPMWTQRQPAFSLVTVRRMFFLPVLHEDYHWYNALDAEGAKTLQDHALLYLAQKKRL